jgi:hypothetical protein
MSKKYTRKGLANAVTSNLDSKAAATKYNIPASTIRQHHREPSLNVHFGRSSFSTSNQEDHIVFLMN